MSLPTAKRLFPLLLFLMIFSVCGQSSLAATRLVTKTVDDGSAGTLRQEIALAAPGDIVAITTSAVIMVTNGQISFDKNLTISVQGISKATISAASNSNIFVVSGGSVTLADLILDEGLDSQGGLVLLLNADLTITSCTLRRGEASDGGGLFVNDGDLRVNASLFEHNLAGNGHFGGGIYLNGGTIIVENSTFANNQADDDGGGIYISNGTATIASCSFISNDAIFRGGALYQSLSTVAIIDCSFDDNEADFGGGLYLFTGTLDISTSTISNNRAAFGTEGGGLYIRNGELILRNSTVANNSASSSGGGIFMNDGAVTAAFCSIHSNTSGSAGGGIYMSVGLLDFDDTIIMSNASTSGPGGGIYISGSHTAAVSFTDCIITTNGSADRGGALNVGSGGGVSLTLERTLLEDNASGSEGGAVHFSDGILNVSSCTFTNNRAASGTNGGGILFSSGLMSIAGTTFANNRANENGGAIMQNGGTITVATCSFDGNRALSSRGGAIMHQGGVILVTNSTFSANISGTDGGGFAATASFADIFNSTFSANEADNRGGGIYSSAPNLDLAGNTISANIADADNNGSGDGGGVWAATDVFLSNLIAGNTDRGGECPDVGAVTGSDGFNLIGTVGQYNFSSNTTGDRYGDPNGTTTPNPGALESATAIDPKLDVLADNGGFGQTHRLLAESPAINASTTAGTSVLDQRGVARFGVPDIGAFELVPVLTIAGSTTPCLQVPEVYSISFFPGASYVWQASGGTISAGQGTTIATVVWTGTTASLSVSIAFGGPPTVTALSISPSLGLPLLDHAVTEEQMPVTLNVLSNDLGSGLQLTTVATPTNGAVSFASSGSLTYTPNAGFVGLEVFHYTLRNSTGCQVTGSVVIAVQPRVMDAANLEFIERRKDRVDAVRGLRRPSDVVVSPDGRHLYAAGQLDHSIAIFSRASTTGSLTYLGRIRHGRGGVTGLRNLSALAISPDGKHLYAAGYRDNSVVVFLRAGTTGSLTFVERLRQGVGGVDGIKRPKDLAVSIDGQTLYVAGFASNAVAVFRRDQLTGRLSYLECHKDGADGVDGLRRAHSVHASPDGTSVYLAGNGDHAVAVFTRSLVDGRLTFLERLRDGVGGVDGLNKATAVFVSPDAAHLYATGLGDRALAVFSRSASTGSLSFVERHRDGTAGVDGLHGAFDVAVSPDGANVYVAGDRDHALALFKRNLSDGELKFEERQRDGVDGVDGLRNARSVIVSPGSEHLYAGGVGDNAVAVFFRNRAPRALGDLESTPSNSSTAFTVLDNDSDPDGHSFTIIGKTDGTQGTVSITGGGTTVTYSLGPAPDGQDSFSYTIDDGHGGSSTATVDVNIVNLKAGAGDFLYQGDQGDVPGGCAICDLHITPNPFDKETRITFTLQQDSDLRIRVLSPTGQLIADLIDMPLAGGRHSIGWDGQSTNCASLSSGSYQIIIDARTANGALYRVAQTVVLYK